MVTKSTALTTCTFLRTVILYPFLRIPVGFPTVELFVVNKIVRRTIFSPWETHNMMTSN